MVEVVHLCWLRWSAWWSDGVSDMYAKKQETENTSKMSTDSIRDLNFAAR